MMLCLLCSHIIFCCMSIQNNTQYSGEDFYVNVAAGKKKKKSHFRFLEKKMFLTNFCIYIMSQVTIQMNTNKTHLCTTEASATVKICTILEQVFKNSWNNLASDFPIKPYVPWGACMCTCDHGSTTGSSGQHPLELVEYCCLLVSLQSNSKAITLWSWPHMGTPVK